MPSGGILARAAVLAVVAILASPAAAAAETARPAAAAKSSKGAKTRKAPGPFDQGLEAYRAGDYENALAAFQRAEKTHAGDPNLDLNIGLTLYKLGRYEEARGRFERIRNDLRYTAVADYHLGLVAAQEGANQQAATYFEDVRYLSSNPRLRTMATVAMLRMDSLALDTDPFTTTAASPRPDLYARAAAGFDSNPELVSEAVAPDLAGEGAGFMDLRGEMNLPLLDTRAGVTYLRADLQNRSYSEERGLDQTSGEVELRQAFHAGDWRVGIAGQGGNAWVDGETYENLYGGSLDGRREYSFAALTLSADTARIDGGSQYEFLDGWRHRAGVEVSRPVATVPVRLNYEFESNDRADLAEGDEFASYSPQRHSVGLALGLPDIGRLSSEWRLRYRNSAYPDADVTDIGGTLVEREREDRLLSVILRGRLRGGARWNWLGDLQYARNESTVDEFDYARHLLLLGVEWLK